MPSSRNNLDPLLGQLGYYGGLTPTIPLLPASPAIDAGDQAAAPPTDQRGVSRPQGTGCDIGAFELAPRLALIRNPEGQVHVEYSFRAGTTNRITASSDLMNWLPLGSAVSDANGSCGFEDNEAVGLPLRFYRIQQK